MCYKIPKGEEKKDGSIQVDFVQLKKAYKDIMCYKILTGDEKKKDSSIQLDFQTDPNVFESCLSQTS